MLSLGNNISATQALEAKYSGVFDGTDDFVDCGLIDFNTNDFSVSCWIKVREWTQYSVIWGNRGDSSTNNIGVALRTTGVTGELQLFSDWGSPTDSSIVTGVPADTWVHVVCTGDRDGNQVIYLNHDDATTTTDISDRSSVDFTSSLEFRIGRSHGTAYHNMSISQLGIWNVVLSANAVEALYNNGKPVNLRINQGNYTNSSDLQQYYKFGNGLFDDKANGIIHDQDNPGFGAELAPSSLSIENGSGGGTITQVSGNSYSSTSDGNNTSVIRPKFDFNTESGKTYKLVITPTGSITGTVHFDFNDGSSYLFQDYDFTTTKEIYFTDNGTVFGAFNGQQVYSISGFTISLKKLNGNPGLTSGGVTFSSDTP